MRHVAWTFQSVFSDLRHQSLLGTSVVVLLLAGALSVAVGTILGLASFRDVGYPDSSTLLRLGEIFRSGHIYPDIDRPPYLVTLYGPLTYVLLGIPYALAQAAGVNPQFPVRLVIVGALGVCVWFIFLMSKRLYNAHSLSWLCVLFAVSTTPFTQWTTQIRGDFLALGFSFMSVYLFLFPHGRSQAMGAAICAGIAVLVKPTFLAAPIAIMCWHIYRQQYKDTAFWATGFVLTIVGGYGIVLWREPLMLQHIAAIRHPVLEYRGALDILRAAVSQPVVSFAALGGLLILWKPAPERLLFLIYCLTAWFVAILTIPQVGGSINYFWEPLLASAVLAGPGLRELQRKAHRTPLLVIAMLFLLFLQSFVPTLRYDFSYLRQAYGKLVDYQLRKTKWVSFLAIVSGRRLLSTFPDVTVYARTPEIADPYLNAVLELRGTWNSDPVVAQIDAGVYDLIVIGAGQASEAGGYRGIRIWSERMWSAIKRRYRPVCAFEGMEIWLPHQDSGEIFSSLLLIGCLPGPNPILLSPGEFRDS